MDVHPLAHDGNTVERGFVLNMLSLYSSTKNKLYAHNETLQASLRRSGFLRSFGGFLAKC